MSGTPGEFLKNVTADEIKAASDDSDNAQDARNGKPLERAEYVDRMFSRLADGYPGLREHIARYKQIFEEGGADPIFIAGISIGAIMLAHDVTIAAEVHDARLMFRNDKS